MFFSCVKIFVVVPVSPPQALIAPVSILSEILSRCPRYFNHAPAGEIWSVVVLPFVLMRTGMLAVSASTIGWNGSRICSRSLFGGTFTDALFDSFDGGIYPM